MAPCRRAKGDEECRWQDSTVAAEDFIQGKKGQATIAIDDNYDVG
jgi:hypothetical protein